MLVLFEFLPTESVITWMLSFTGDPEEQSVDLKSIENESINESHNLLKNGGTFMILGFCVIFMIVLILLLSKCEAIIYSNYKVFSLYMKLKQKLFFNSIIRFFMTSCIKL